MSHLLRDLLRDSLKQSIKLSPAFKQPILIGLMSLVLTACGGGGGGGGSNSAPAPEDTTAPVISVSGAETLTIELGDSYSDAGATATDNVDSAVTVSTAGSVTNTVAGDYTLTYSATDAAGNSATATRVVTVSGIAIADPLIVFDDGVVGATWDLALNGYDQQIDYAECSDDGGAACPNVNWALVTDADRGTVLQISHSSANIGAAVYTKTSSPVDASAYAGGNIVLDIIKA